VCTHTHTQARTRARTHTHTHTCTYTHTHTHTHMYICKSHTHTHLYTHTHRDRQTDRQTDNSTHRWALSWYARKAAPTKASPPPPPPPPHITHTHIVPMGTLLVRKKSGPNPGKRIIDDASLLQIKKIKEKKAEVLSTMRDNHRRTFCVCAFLLYTYVLYLHRRISHQILKHSAPIA
jgi:hypothetical protein